MSFEKYEEQQKTKKKIEKYKNIRDKLNVTLSNYQSFVVDVSDISKDIQNYSDFIEYYDKQIENRDKVKERIAWEEAERERIKSYINKNLENVEKFKNENGKIEKKLGTTKKKLDYLKALKNLCTDEEVKQYAISNKIPVLNKQVNEYLSKTGVNYFVKLDNWLDIEINGPGRRGCTYNDLSGAERVSIDRSLQFSFSDMNKIQSPVFVDLLILDELIDSSVDNQGMINLLNIIKTKQQNDNSKVLLVSHRKGFENIDEVIDNFYCVEYDGSYSKVKEM
jgi:DNA repair exonuclease SbcCD ATPase subunit